MLTQVARSLSPKITRLASVGTPCEYVLLRLFPIEVNDSIDRALRGLQTLGPTGCRVGGVYEAAESIAYDLPGKNR